MVKKSKARSFVDTIMGTQPEKAPTVRIDMKSVPKDIYDALIRATFELKMATGIAISAKDATIRGMELAAEELKHARGPEAIKRIYKL